MTTIELYRDHENLLRKVCHQFTGGKIEFDDLMSEAKIVFFRARKTYDPSQGAKFSTYLYTLTRNHLINLCRREQRRPTVSLDERFTASVVDQQSIWDGVSDDAHVIIDLVLEAPKELIELLTPMKGRAAVVRYLKQLGWSTLRVKRAVVEIQEALS